MTRSQGWETKSPFHAHLVFSIEQTISSSMVLIKLEVSGLKSNRALPLLISLPKLPIIYDYCHNVDQS